MAMSRTLAFEEGCRPSLRVGPRTRSYSCARTISTEVTARRAVRPSLSPVLVQERILLGREYSSSGYGSSDDAVPAWRKWSFKEVRKLVDGVGGVGSEKVAIIGAYFYFFFFFGFLFICLDPWWARM